MSVRNFCRVRPSIPKAVARLQTAQALPSGGQAGFSLIEAMIVVAIVAVLVVVAAPNINHALEVQRNKELSQAIYVALKEARSEALFRHQNIRVFYDNTSIKLEQVVAPSTGSAIIRTYPVRKAGTISPESDIITFGANKSVTTKKGFNAGNKAIIQTMCNSEGKIGRKVTVNNLGVIAIETGDSKC